MWTLICNSPSFQIWSNIYKHQSQLQIERLKLYFSTLGKMASLIFIRYMWYLTSAGSTAGSSKLDWIGLISPLNRCRQGSEKQGKDMTNIQRALEPSPSSESSQLHICWHPRLWWLPDIGFVQCTPWQKGLVQEKQFVREDMVTSLLDIECFCFPFFFFFSIRKEYKE